MSSPSISLAPGSRDANKHRRASVACKVCHSRKVRCNISTTSGRPCSSCLKYGHNCVPHISLRGKAGSLWRNAAQSVAVDAAQREPVASFEQSSARLRTIGSSEPETASAWVGGFDGHDENSRAPSSSMKSATTATAMTIEVDRPFASNASATTVSDSSTAEEDCRSNIEGYKSIFTSGLAQQDPSVVLFMGESQGIRSLFHMCGDEALASQSHFWVPRVESAPFPPEDYEFLKAKGAFSLPPNPVLWELIDTYFRRVHPLLPAIDPVTFLSTYEHNGPQGISVLLLQCMFLAACNYISPELIQQAGAPSVKAMKKQFYIRAKALFDLNYEKDKITLIQSSLLLGYWFGMSYDRIDGWHWTSTSISLAQSVGLHRNPTHLKIPDRQRNQWKRLWWCLFYRDRFTSVGMGRPLRIRLADCDADVPTPTDLMVSNHLSLGLSEKARAIIESCNLVAPVFTEVVKLCFVLGEVIDCHFMVEKKESVLEDIRQCETKLIHWYDNLDSSLRIDLSRHLGDDAASSLQAYKYILNLYFQFVTITLHRPLLYRTSNDFSLQSVRDKAWTISSTAAAASIEVLQRIIDQDMIKWLPPEIVTVINSLMVVCFLQKIRSEGRLKKQIAINKIELCFTIMREVSERYWAASFFLSYFEAAFDRAELLCSPSSISSNMANHGNTSNNSHNSYNGNNTSNTRAAPFGSSSGNEQSPSGQEGGSSSAIALSDSSTIVDGLTSALEPDQNLRQQWYTGLQPVNFWANFTEDLPLVDPIDFGFGSSLE